jgi:hypothetical protein
VAAHVRTQLSPETQKVLANAPANPDPRGIEALLIHDLNAVLAGPSLYESERFAGIELRRETRDLLDKANRSSHESLSLNRLLLEDAFPVGIARQHNQPAEARQGFRTCSGILVGILFAICTVFLIAYQLNKQRTIQMAEELAERRKQQPAA